jgi:IS5 family transposase
VDGLRKTRYRGLARVNFQAQLVATAYNLMRITNLMPLPA